MSIEYKKLDYSGKRWPEYRLSIPKQVELTCPECGAQITCDVEINEEAAPACDQAVAVAEIETDRCEGCAKPLCPQCPRTVDPDSLEFCRECVPATEAERSEQRKKAADK